MDSSILLRADKYGSYIFAVENNQIPLNKETFNDNLIPIFKAHFAYSFINSKEIFLYSENNLFFILRFICRVALFSIWLISLLTLVISVFNRPKCPKLTSWWQNTVIYEIWVPSFYDSDGDGTGDLTGIQIKLKELERLGIGALLIRKPRHSHKNDDFDDEFRLLIEAAHKRNVRIITEIPFDAFLNNEIDFKLGKWKSLINSAISANIDGIYLGSLDDCKKYGHERKWSSILSTLHSIRSYAEDFTTQNWVAKREKFFLLASTDQVGGKSTFLAAETGLNALANTELLTISPNSKICRHKNSFALCLTEAISDLLKCYHLNGLIQPIWKFGGSYVSRTATRMSSKARSELLAMMSFMLPGIASLYYGDEIGMHDLISWQNSPQRGAMLWDDTPNAGFSSNISAGTDQVSSEFKTNNIKRELRNNNSRINLLKKLINLKLRASTLIFGHTYMTVPMTNSFAIARYLINDDKSDSIGRGVYIYGKVFIFVANFGSSIVHQSLVDIPIFQFPHAYRKGKVVTFNSNARFRFRLHQKIDLKNPSITLGPNEGVVLCVS